MVKKEARNVRLHFYQQDEHRPNETIENASEELPYSLDSFKKKLRMSIVKCDDEELEFDMIGVNPAIANAIRRILIAEVPTMAADRITVINNTSFLNDKDLTNRVGLVPIKVDPRLFEYRNKELPPSSEDTIIFQLTVRCKKNIKAPMDATDPKELYEESSVYSKHLEWLPLDGQEVIFARNPPKPIHDDILIAKMRPGQEIDLKIEYLKGIGKTHAKFSPVATASYRLLPTIEMLGEVRGEAALRFKDSFSRGVVEVVEERGEKVARVVNARMDTCSRNVLLYEDLADKVKLGRVSDHFIFSVESVGMLPPDVLVKESIKVMLQKCKAFLDQIEKVRGGKSDEGMDSS